MKLVNREAFISTRGSSRGLLRRLLRRLPSSRRLGRFRIPVARPTRILVARPTRIPVIILRGPRDDVIRRLTRVRALQLTVLAHYVGQLVTHDRTYAVRKGETSNAQLLVPSAVHAICHRPEGGRADDGAVGCVVANVMQHYELLPIGPRLRMLPALLSRRPYEGPDNDAEQDMDESAPARLTRSEVEATLQASPAEIRAEMLRLGAVEIDGRVCLMDHRYERSFANHLSGL